MSSRSDCPDCAQFWDEYSKATNAHFRAESKLKVASLSHELDRVGSLRDEAELAARRRIAARDRLRHHERTAHHPHTEHRTSGAG